MDNKNERSLNITLKNEEQQKDEVIISFSTIFKMLKKFLAFWLVLAILVGILIPIYSIVFAADQHKNLTALVSFNYDGIEKGLAPDGNPFDPITLKNPAVIEAALTELDIPLTALENIRQGIKIEGLVPQNAINEISMNRDIYEQGNLAAGKAMLEVDVNPTQYRVLFNYSRTGFTGETAVNVLNTMLNKYREYFFEIYGYNKALGNAVTSFDYSLYDYAPAVEVFDTSLVSLQRYVTELVNQDQTHFRSSATGYTFSDLSAAINTLQTVDLDQLSSFITINNVTKDKKRLIDYYTDKIETLARQRNIAEDELAELDRSISNYTKDVVIIYGDQESSQYSRASEAYDKMFERKMTAQNTLSTATQQINMYQQRVNVLKSKNVADQEMIDRVEADMADLNARILDMLDKVNETANEFYETVYLGNAYSILVPATTSSISTASSVMSSSKESVLIAEALIVAVYLVICFMMALLTDNRKKTIFPQKAESEDVDASAEVKDSEITSDSDKK